MKYHSRKQESKDLPEQINDLIKEGKDDREIADTLDIAISRVRQIRITVLQISYYNAVKFCEKCKQKKTVNCFNASLEEPYKNWCIACRREEGMNPYPKRRVTVGRGKRPWIHRNCLTCGNEFKARAVNDHGGYEWVCKTCQKRNTEIERCSI